MKVLLIFFVLLAVLIGVIALGLHFFKFLLKTRQKEKKSTKTDTNTH